MKLKTDENIGRSGIELPRASGHDVSTVVDEGLQGGSDSALHVAASEEGRILVTLDRGFGQVLRFLDRQTPGIVILDCGKPITRTKFLAVCGNFWHSPASISRKMPSGSSKPAEFAFT